MPGMADLSVNSAVPAAALPASPKPAARNDGFSFDDLLDIVNPLHHFPVISTLYKHLSGDDIGVPEKIIGDGIYGGAIGLLCSVGDAIFEEITGKSVGDTVYAFVTGEDDTHTAVATGPIAVTPAASFSLSMPDLSGLFEDERGPSPAIVQRATAAYSRAMGRSVAPY